MITQSQASQVLDVLKNFNWVSDDQLLKGTLFPFRDSTSLELGIELPYYGEYWSNSQQEALLFADGSELINNENWLYIK